MPSDHRHFVQRLAAFVPQHPWKVLLAGFLLLAALAPGASRLVQQHNFRIWFPQGDPVVKQLDDFERRFGSESATILVIHSPSGIFDKDSAQLIIDLTERLWKVDEVIRVESLANFSWVHGTNDEIFVDPLIPDDQELTDEILTTRREVALNHELLPGYLISADGKTATIFAWLQPAVIGHADDEFVTDANYAPHVKSLKLALEDFRDRGDHEIRVAGFPSMEVYLEYGPGVEMQGLMPAIIGSIVLLLLIFFRRPAGLLPIAVIIPSVIGMMGAAGWMGLSINPLTVMGPNIMVILAVSNSVHLLFPYFRALNAGATRKEAAEIALGSTLSPSFFACLTTGIGFLGLLAMTIPPIRELGAMIAVGSLIVWIYILALLGPLLVILPIRSIKKRAKAGLELDDLDSPSERAERMTAWLDRRRFVVVGAFLAVVALSLFLAFAHGEVDFEPDDFFDPRTDIRQGMDALKHQLGTAETIEVIIDSGEEDGIKDPAFLAKVDELGSWLAAKQDVIRVLSLVDILKQMNRALHDGDQAHYVLPDTRQAAAELYLLYTMNLPLGKNLNDQVTVHNDALRMTILSSFDSSPKVIATNDEIRKKAKELGLDVKITGRLVLSYELNPRIVKSVTQSIGAATIMIAIALLLIFRSFKLGILSLFLNVIPLVFGAGVVFYLADQSYNMGTIPAFAIALGVAVDDTVHFLTGFQRLRRKGYSTREAISRLWSIVVPAMIITTAVLTVCFGVFIFITFPILRMLGTLTASILVAALLVDAVLLPAILLVFDRGDADPKTPRAVARDKK